MNKFENLGLPESLLSNLKKIGFETPTPIQAGVIPHAISGKDVLGNAQTGTGKTAAFAIPAAIHLMKNSTNCVLILLPTRELAAQVLTDTLKIMGPALRVNSTLLIGGESADKQIKQIKMGPRLIVGTPGRINDHLKSRKLRLEFVDLLILDETDRMLDMGFGRQIETIISEISPAHQTLMLSATFPKNIMELSGKYLNNPQRVACGNENVVTDTIKQELMHTTDEDKYKILIELLDKQTDSVLVFTKTKYGAERLMKRLVKEKFAACALHGDMRQTKRDRSIADFRRKKCNVMVATDIAARGLDISHISCVINYDMPQAAEDYIHRIGRTGRAGTSGVAINLLTKKDHKLWREICKLLKTDSGLPPEPANDKKPTSTQNRRPRKPFKKRIKPGAKKLLTNKSM